MAPLQWAEGEQLTRLEDFLPTYLEYAQHGNYQDCWPQLFIPWFVTWAAHPIPLPNLALPPPDTRVAPVAPAVPTLTAKQAAAAKAKLKRETDWQTELAELRLMTTAQQDVWCHGQGVIKKKQVRALSCIRHLLRNLMLLDSN